MEEVKVERGRREAPVLERPSSSDASAVFGVKLRSAPRVVRPVVAEGAPEVGATVAS